MATSGRRRRMRGGSPDELAGRHAPRMPLELFPFSYFDELRGRWVRARYKATREDIAARHERWEITGPGWTPARVGGSFAPFAKPAAN